MGGLTLCKNTYVLEATMAKRYSHRMNRFSLCCELPTTTKLHRIILGFYAQFNYVYFLVIVISDDRRAQSLITQFKWDAAAQREFAYTLNE